MAFHQTPVEVRSHIEHKSAAGEISRDVADRMLVALAAGANPDYQALLADATFLPMPARCFHTAPTAAREAIAVNGLVAALPEDGTWGVNAVAQEPGVYVSATPDEIGTWSLDPEWDVWEIGTSDLSADEWTHDRINPGCWLLRGNVPTARLKLWGTVVA